MKKIFAANWKLHKNPTEAKAFCNKLKMEFEKVTNQNQKRLILFPSAISLDAVSQCLGGSEVEFGCQNCYYETKGAFTGENSAAVVKDLGGKWVLIGHSERRQYFSETNSILAKKIQSVLSLGLRPLLCIGESLAERESGKTFSVLETQLKEALVECHDKTHMSIAYEPIWAIGTGRVATLDQIKETHEFIFKTLTALGFVETTPILYGGSVKPENASEILNLPHVDGCLVGGASLEVDSFLKIVGSLGE